VDQVGGLLRPGRLAAAAAAAAAGAIVAGFGALGAPGAPGMPVAAGLDVVLVGLPAACDFDAAAVLTGRSPP